MANANLSWDPALGAVSYRVEYKLQSDGGYTLFNSSISQTNTIIPGLAEGKAYDFRVSSNCSTGSAGGIVFSGNTPCLDVSGLSATFTGTTASLLWSKKTSAVSYVVEYKLQSTGIWTAAAGSPRDNLSGDPVPFTITGLQAGSAYDFRVKVNCVVGTSTGSVVSATSSCANVSNLNVTFS